MFFNCSIHPFNYDLYSGRYPDNGYSDAESDSDSEDSNSESHWRNEYPDEDEDGDESIGEKDMRRAVNNLDLGMLFHWSVDTYVHSKLFPDDDLSEDEDLDDDDANRYGIAYSKYKKRVLKRNNYFDGVVDDDGDYISDLSNRSEDSDWETFQLHLNCLQEVWGIFAK